MAKSDYISKGDDSFAAQLHAFRANIGSYAANLGITAAQMNAQAADADYYVFVLQCQKTMLNGSQQWTAWKNLMRNGGTPPPTGMPVAPVFPPAVAAVPLGVESRFRALVKQIKSSANYNQATGEALGIEGPQQSGPDLATIQPIIDAQISGNRVEVDWSWNGSASYLDICEIQVDRNDGKGFVFLTFDTTPGYVDTQPFPTTPTKWTYRAIFRVADAQVGRWSNPVSVTTPG